MCYQQLGTMRLRSTYSAPESNAVQVDHLELLSGGKWVPLSYVRDGDIIYLVSTEGNAKWPGNVLRRMEATLRLDGIEITGRAELLSVAEEREQVFNMFRRKYGDELFASWFPRPGRVLRITLGSRAATDYFAWLEQEFDAVAEDYDMHITGNSINMLLRNRSLALMGRVFTRPSHLLEIGCGSGMETIPMLSRGHEVLAVDISSRMLDIVRRKAEQQGLLSGLRLMKLRASDIGQLTASYGDGAFDGSYSTYGALNCEPSLEQMPAALHSLIRNEGHFVAGVYNRICMFEMVVYGLRLNLRRVASRMAAPVEEGNSRFCVDVYSYSVPAFTALFRDYFSVRHIEGVPVILPPSDFDRYLSRFRRHFGLLERADAWAGNLPLFRSLGDHFLAVFERKER